MKLQDGLLHWLQIRLVVEARPDDQAAISTVAFFEEVLRTDLKVQSFEITDRNEATITITYELDGQSHVQTFHSEIAQQLLIDICNNPKYNE